ncbi:hypothetical protein GMD78_03575 [Ornithinibacillus sp. L9]|uniref:Uncharacterized protein n=1 Tax=Ornithinibacillus caprae TaxID=2678566 RepID=A0A6N8FI98_9BACI|nr:anti-sigma factor [Ornithinibacillus caprae]MUK87479.1 hypothetical protein [Ornithinibacillus caprae]
MSEDFKKKLLAYEKGELQGEELEAFEKEMEKLEYYQEMLEGKEDQQPLPTINEKKQKRIITKGKWKARFQTALTVFGLFILFTIVSTALTLVYYSWGKPDRVDVYRGILDYTLTITEPYGYLGGTSTNSTAFFGLEASRDIRKRVGNETIKVGELTVDFRFSLMGFPEREYIGQESEDRPAFSYPNIGHRNMSDWEQLENLPEGTVVSAYVSFNDLMETREVESLFSNREMFLEWLAVDTGIEETDEKYGGIIFDPIGFPSTPIWHDDDMILTSSEEDKRWFGGTKSESYQSPVYNEGDQDMLHEQFMKTLYFLKDHEKKANRLVFLDLQLEDRITYLEENGIKHYGAVITGPTKEVLNLQDESWVAELEVDEVAFWNWE